MKLSDEVREIPLDQISVSAYNVRVTDKDAGVDELAASIDRYGLLQPVVLIGQFGTPPYQLVVGQRRFRAHQKLNKSTIRALFYEEQDEVQLRMLSLSENIHRVELNYADKAAAITDLYNQFGKNAKKTAQELGLSVSSVIEYVKLEEQATETVKTLLREKKVKKEDAKRAISAAQGDSDIIDRLIVEIPKLTKYEKDRLVDFGKREKVAVDKLIEEAKKPRFEKTIILTLNEDTDHALSSAEDQLAKGREEIAAMALEEWLRENGFYKPAEDRIE